MSVKLTTIPTKFLQQSISASATSFKVNNIKSWALNSLGVNINLTSADFGTTAYCVFRNDTGSKIEIMEFDPSTIASSSITIVRRGLGFDGDLTTETTNYKLSWPKGSVIEFGTDVPQLLKSFVNTKAIGIVTSGVSLGTDFAETRYADSGGNSSIEADGGNIIPFAGTLLNLYVYVYANDLNAGAITFTVMKNTVAQAVTFAVNAGVTGVASDTTHSFSVSAGDRITIRNVTGGASGSVGWGFSYLIQ